MSGDNGALTVILLGAAATFIWRLLGIGLSSRLRPDDAVIQWMTHIAYAVLAALVGRMVIAPTGDMAAVRADTARPRAGDRAPCHDQGERHEQVD